VVVPFLTYGAPIWVEAIQKNKNLIKYKRIQRRVNIKIAKVYQTLSYDAAVRDSWSTAYTGNYRTKGMNLYGNKN
jgi:hypothetical protein